VNTLAGNTLAGNTLAGNTLADRGPLHLGFLTTEYPPRRAGGIGSNVRNLARALVAAGHRVTVLGWGQECAFDDHGVSIRFLGATRLPRLGWLLNRRRVARAIDQLVRHEGLVAIEAHDWCGPSAGMRPACALGIRCNGSATYFGDLLGERVRAKVRWTERRALAGADGVVAVSRFTAQRTQRLFGLASVPGVIPNGVDMARFSPAPMAQAVAGEVLFLGTLVRKKGLLDLLCAFDQVLDACPEARLRLVGRDARDTRTGADSTWALGRQGLAAHARERVLHPGPLAPEAVPAAIARATVCAFPSYAEALPLAWIEAMACARPVVAYDVGWAAEIITSGHDGILVPAGERQALARAIISLLASPQRAARMGLAARQSVARRFDASAVARTTADWLRSLAIQRMTRAGERTTP